MNLLGPILSLALQQLDLDLIGVLVWEVRHIEIIWVRELNYQIKYYRLW